VQSRIDSIIEVGVNILIGFAVALTANLIILPAHGYHGSLGSHVSIVAWFTGVSVLRQYVIRRLCNGRSPWRYLRERFCV
jgi:hypothetical protein